MIVNREYHHVSWYLIRFEEHKDPRLEIPPGELLRRFAVEEAGLETVAELEAVLREEAAEHASGLCSLPGCVKEFEARRRASRAG